VAADADVTDSTAVAAEPDADTLDDSWRFIAGTEETEDAAAFGSEETEVAAAASA
jgi:hypothetical protein